MVSKHVVTAGAVFATIALVLSSCSGDTSDNCYFDTRTAQAVCYTPDSGVTDVITNDVIVPFDVTQQDVFNGSCSQLAYTTNGVNCTTTGCTGLTCQCPGGFPISVTACTGVDGCINGGDCNIVCAAGLAKALSCTGTHTVVRTDAGGDSCVPKTCRVGATTDCGSPPDACGGTLNCGNTCPTLGPNTTCGGGGVQFVCGCTAGSPTTVGVNTGSNGLDNASLGAVAWTSPSLAVALDSALATATLAQGQVSHYLEVEGFNFFVPSGATIQGIEVDVRRSSTNGVGIQDQSVKLVKNGAIIGTEHATATTWPNTLATAVYGGPTDLWGTTWLPSDVNSATFGAAIAAYRNSAAADAPNVDSIQIKVTYATSCP
jgi:hypothetical protein